MLRPSDFSTRNHARPLFHDITIRRNPFFAQHDAFLALLGMLFVVNVSSNRSFSAKSQLLIMQCQRAFYILFHAQMHLLGPVKMFQTPRECIATGAALPSETNNKLRPMTPCRRFSRIDEKL